MNTTMNYKGQQYTINAEGLQESYVKSVEDILERDEVTRMPIILPYNDHTADVKDMLITRFMHFNGYKDREHIAIIVHDLFEEHNPECDDINLLPKWDNMEVFLEVNKRLGFRTATTAEIMAMGDGTDSREWAGW